MFDRHWPRKINRGISGKLWGIVNPLIILQKSKNNFKDIRGCVCFPDLTQGWGLWRLSWDSYGLQRRDYSGRVHYLQRIYITQVFQGFLRQRYHMTPLVRFLPLVIMDLILSLICITVAMDVLTFESEEINPNKGDVSVYPSHHMMMCN